MNIEKMFSIPKSFWVSLHFFPLKDALKLPILVRYNTSLLSLKGKVVAQGGVNTAMLSVGFCSVGLYDKKYQRSILQIDGTIELSVDGKVSFGQGARISIGKNGCVTFKGEFSNTAQMNLCCVDSIKFGSNVVTSWDTLVMDTDWHEVINTESGVPSPCTKPVEIGDGVWIGTRAVVLKGSRIPNGCIVGAGSLVTKRYCEEDCLIAGNPAKVRKQCVTLKRS
ncbi:acyltransferase [Leyella stercorea]|nr:acyltransferase [Leyella stercorea]